MKKIYFFAFLLCGHNLLAQVTLTSATHGIIPGTVNSVYSADTAAYTPGPSGASQTWNFSGLIIDTLVNNGTFVDPATTPYSSVFPGTTIAIDNGGGDFSYSTQTSTSLTFNGSSDGTYNFTFSNPEELLKFPFSYGNTSIDNFVGGYDFGMAHDGTMSLDADAYGTLVLPWGSFNTLRVKSTENYTDTYSPYVFLRNVIIYNWYTATEPLPILQYIIATTSGSSTGYFKGITVNAAVVGIKELDRDDSFLSIFPNPANSFFNLNYVLPQNSSVTISIIDILGKTVLNKDEGIQSEGKQTIKIDLSNLKSGIYFIRLNYGNNLAVKKIQVN